jgi:hypothetical protein
MSDTTQTEKQSNADKPKQPRHRSPSYPSIDLATAITRVAQLEAIAKSHPVQSATVIKEAWGYSPTSSNGTLAMAALKKYGLIENRAKGEVQISRLGRETLVHAADSPERLARLQTAALSPTFNSEIWAKYGPVLPADSVILPYLILERQFSEAAAKEALRLFKLTANTAHLADAGVTVESDENDNEAERGGEDDGDGFVSVATDEPGVSTPAIPPAIPPAPSQDTPQPPPPIQIRVQGRTVVLRESQALTGSEWDKMIDILKMLRPEDV